MDALDIIKMNTDQTSLEDNDSYVSSDENHFPGTTAAPEHVAKPTSETIGQSLTTTTSRIAEQEKHTSVREKLLEYFGFMAIYQGCKRLWEQACRRAREQWVVGRVVA